MGASKKNRRRNQAPAKKMSPKASPSAPAKQPIEEIPVDILNKLEPAQKQQLNIILAQQQEQYSGPIPHPAHLAKFEEILPGSAERFMAVVETEGTHRRKRENITNGADITQNIIAQLSSLIIILTGILAGTYLAINGHSVVGAAMVGGPLCAAAIAHLKFRNNTQKNGNAKK